MIRQYSKATNRQRSRAKKRKRKHKVSRRQGGLFHTMYLSKLSRNF